MSATRCVIAVVMVVWSVSAVTAQSRPMGRADVRGVVQSVDATAGTITIVNPAGRGEAAVEKTYKLTQDAEIALDNGRRAFQPGTLKGIPTGTTVSLTLTADQKAVESVLVEGATVRGTVKAVDAGKRTITVTPGFGRGPDVAAEEKTYPVAEYAEVVMDDGRGRRFSTREVKLTEVGTGTTVSLRLSADQKQAVMVMVEAAGVYGTVKSVDAPKNTITLTTNPGRGDGPEEQTIVATADTVTLLDDGGGRRLSVKEGKLADIPVGSAVTVRLSLDQKAATLIRAEGPTFGGMLKAVDADKGTITVVRPSRTDPPEEKTVKLPKNVRVIVDGKEGAVSDLKAGDETFVMLRLSLDQKTATSLFVGRGR